MSWAVDGGIASMGSGSVASRGAARGVDALLSNVGCCVAIVGDDNVAGLVDLVIICVSTDASLLNWLDIESWRLLEYFTATWLGVFDPLLVRRHQKTMVNNSRKIDVRRMSASPGDACVACVACVASWRGIVGFTTVWRPSYQNSTEFGSR